jgi:hypothetical protein
MAEESVQLARQATAAGLEPEVDYHLWLGATATITHR